MNEDVVVTGIGLLTAAGLSTAENWQTIQSGRSGIKRATAVPVDGFISDTAGELPGGTGWSSRRLVARGSTPIDRAHGIAVDAVAQAVESAQLIGSGYASERIAVSLGTSLGGARLGEVFHRQWLHRGLRRADNSLLRQYPLHSVADSIAATFGFTGPRNVQSNACAAGAVAIAYGLELLRCGVADVVVAGGVDPLAYFSYGGFSCLGALDPDQCAPYTRSSGLNLGEGAGIVILERRDRANARGATVIGVLNGYGLSADAYHPTAPDPTGRGATRAVRAALEMGGIGAEQIDYVNGHGTGTPANDSVETRVLAHLREGEPPPVSSTKSMIGHTLGAAGAVEAVTTLMAIDKQTLPPTFVPDTTIDAPLGLDIVAGQGRAAGLNYAVSNSFAFGGNNAALLLGNEATRTAPGATTERSVVVSEVTAIVGTAGDTEAVRDALRRRRTMIGSTTISLEDFGTYPIAEIADDDLKRGINPQHLRRMDTLSRRAAVAVAELLRRKRLPRDQAQATGLIFATGTGPISTVEAFERELIETGNGNTRLFPNTVMNAAAGHVALLHRLQGPTATVCAGGTSGISALHFATRLIATGAADRMIVLAADEAPAAMLAGYAGVPGYLSRGRSEPFGDSGKVFGGAAVALLLEAEEVVSTGAPLGRIKGFGLTGDMSGAGRLDPSGAAWARSFTLAMDDADLMPDDVSSVIAAACGRRQIDDVELSALRQAGLDQAAVIAPKELTGDAGASSAMLGIAQALWMIADEDPSGLEHNAGGHSASREHTLVSAFEVGGSYQSVIVGAA